MNFIPIVPVEYLDLVKDRDRHLILPAMLKQYPEYRKVYTEASGFKTLDNGEAEGQQGEPEELFEWANRIGAQEIVVPDTLFDAEASIRQVVDFAPLAQKHPKYSYMAVVQGNTVEELVACFECYSTYSWITRIALPRAMGNIHRGLRMSMTEALKPQILNRFVGIHCLGAIYNFVREPLLLASIPDPNPIVSMDSSLPAILALQGQHVQVTTVVESSRPVGFWEAPFNEDVFDLMAFNIGAYDFYCS